MRIERYGLSIAIVRGVGDAVTAHDCSALAVAIADFSGVPGKAIKS